MEWYQFFNTDCKSVCNLKLPNLGSRTQQILEVIAKNGGVICETPVFVEDAVYLRHIVFESNSKRMNCINKVGCLMSQLLLEELDPKARLAFAKILSFWFDLNQKMNPLLKYVEEHGGAFNPITGESPGIDMLFERGIIEVVDDLDDLLLFAKGGPLSVFFE